MRADTRSTLYDDTTTTAISAVLASYKCKTEAVIVLTTNSNNFSDTIKWLARFFYTNDRPADWLTDVDERVQYTFDFGKKANIVPLGDNVVVKTGWRKDTGSPNTFRTLSVELGGIN